MLVKDLRDYTIKNFQKIYGKKQKNKIDVNESEFRHGTAQEYLDTEFDY